MPPGVRKARLKDLPQAVAFGLPLEEVPGRAGTMVWAGWPWAEDGGPEPAGQRRVRSLTRRVSWAAVSPHR